jgi:hypothetical protein
MKKDSQIKKKQSHKSYELEYSENLEAMVFKILDSDGMHPCYWHDAENGKYRKIIKTRNGNVQMV